METTTKGLLTWQDVCEDPNLDDLPYKIELNEWGQIVMSPTRVQHGAYQSTITRLLWNFARPNSQVIIECAIQTTKGTKVADVVWASAARWEQVKDELACSISPEICVEVLSPTNAKAEIEQKRALYFEAGAEEVWICDKDGAMHFYRAGTLLEHSVLVPGFPMQITL